MKRALRAAAPALVALAACLVCYLAGWRGTDWAAQVYRSAQVANHGLAIWDPGWYGGTFPLSYSLLYPLAAGYLGLWPVAAASAAGAAFCFDRLVTDDLGRRPLASWYFAVATAIALSIGQLPTLAGEALALGCTLCLAQGLAHKTRRATTGRKALWVTAGALMGAMAAVTTPIAGVFLSLSLVAWGAADLGRAPRRQVVGRLAAGGAVGILAVALPVIFSSPGYFFFAFGDVAVVLVISAIVASPMAPGTSRRQGRRGCLRGDERGTIRRPHPDGWQRRPIRRLRGGPAHRLLRTPCPRATTPRIALPDPEGGRRRRRRLHRQPGGLGLGADGGSC